MGHLYFNIIHDHSLPKTSRGLRRFFGAYINCPEQNFSDPNNLRPSTLKTNPGQPLLRSDGRCVFSNARRTKFHFINLMRRAIFVFRYVRFFPGTSPPKYARVDLAPNCLPQHPSGEDVPKKKRTYLKTKIACLIKFIHIGD